MNLGGASDRPEPTDIWALVQAKMSDPANADTLPTQLHYRGHFSICAILYVVAIAIWNRKQVLGCSFLIERRKVFCCNFLLNAVRLYSAYCVS